MNKLISFVVSSILVAGVFGCQEPPKTGSETPAKTDEATSVPAQPASATTQITEKPPLSTPAATNAASDLKTEVSKKLKEGLPSNKLEVENKEGEIILKGVATSEEELKKAEALVKQVKGVKSVKVEAKVAPEKKI